MGFTEKALETVDGRTEAFGMGTHRPLSDKSRDMCSFTRQEYVLLTERLEKVHVSLGKKLASLYHHYHFLVLLESGYNNYGYFIF